MYDYYTYIRAPNLRETEETETDRQEREETDTVQCTGYIMLRLMVRPVPNVV